MNQFCKMKDSKLPTTFWAEVVNTACYVQNRVLVVKPHNKTPCELFHGRTPTLSFMRPFGCPVTILNTKDHLGKFDGKADEGLFVGYSLNSKAFRVFNNRTRIVEENLNIRFSENTPNIQKEISLMVMQVQRHVMMQSCQDDGFQPSSDDGKKVDEDPRQESKCKDQEKKDNVNNTNNVNAACTNGINVVDDDKMADMNNLDTIIQVSPTLTTRIHKDHHIDQVIRDMHSTTQTRNMSKNLEEHCLRVDAAMDREEKNLVFNAAGEELSAVKQKLMLLDSAAESKLRLLMASAAAEIGMKK
nr:retrovirus-related Pol polyprotein from transposon TNT 1-94 [Tanacetum cinerariifolium]